MIRDCSKPTTQGDFVKPSSSIHAFSLQPFPSLCSSMILHTLNRSIETQVRQALRSENIELADGLQRWHSDEGAP